MPRPKSVATLITETKTAMKVLSIYRPEFDQIITIYCQLLHQYDTLNRKYVNNGMEYEVYTKTGVKKAPIVTTLESLRKDIAAYAVYLGLTPSGLKTINKESGGPIKKVSKLEMVLMDIEEGGKRQKQ